MADLTAATRNALPNADFVDKKDRKYPIPDKSHARAALSRGSQFASPALKSKIKNKVAKKFPGISQKGKTKFAKKKG